MATPTPVLESKPGQIAAKTNRPQMAPLAVQGMKRHLNGIARGALDIDVLRQDIQLAQASEDLLEGVKAKVEKREPVFIGA